MQSNANNATINGPFEIQEQVEPCNFKCTIHTKKKKKKEDHNYLCAMSTSHKVPQPPRPTTSDPKSYSL
jgi:hypothetical protein